MMFGFANKPFSSRRVSTAVRRKSRLELLESRRLLVAEGAIFNLTAPVDTAGLVGSASAKVDWGDGTVTDATITGGNATGNVKIVLDYSLDTSRFFGTTADNPRRIKLQQAADALVSRFADTLTAVAPVPNVTVRPRIFHPSIGAANSPVGDVFSLPENPTIPANTIIIYAGARDLPGNARGVGGTGSAGFTRTCIPGAQCDQALAAQRAIESRGQPGVLTSPATDIAPMYGSISFDAPTGPMFYVGDDPNAIAANQLDFLSVATHELAHALGFGTAEAWTNLASSGSFAGPKAKAVYVGSGNVPIIPAHWAPEVVDRQPTLMSASINFGQRVAFSPLDFAAMDDIGWDVVSTSATVTATHRYADNGNYPVTVVLSGSRIGDIRKPVSSASVTNVPPTLEAIANRIVLVDQSISINGIGFTDPGFANPAAEPPTSETFSYSINWGDGTVDVGAASVSVNGNAAGRLTSGSFGGNHVYDSTGSKTVTVRIEDDDGGADQTTFTIDVTAPPMFQNPMDRFDVNAVEGVTTLDALLVINRLGRQATPQLDPETDAPGPNFFDVNGDDMVTPLDALLVINEIARRRNAESPSMNFEGVDVALRSVSGSWVDEDPDESVFPIELGGLLF